ncbi:MAG: DUF177 domain-containing protein [Eubacteriaceae bacterium]|nr:DUF177 domain-containing protein [Eubacteriaceae bacterium]
MMRIQRELLQNGKPYPFSFVITQEVLGDPRQELSGVISEAGLLAEGQIKLLNQTHLDVSFHLSGDMLYPCARCLKPTAFPCEFDYHETIDIPEDEQDEISILPAIEECLFVNEPFRVLCRPDCKGLCPRCGADLNDGPCDCPETEPETDPRMAALKALL